MNKEKTNITQDSLKYLFIKARENLMSESDATKINLTDVFNDWLVEKVSHNELIVIQVRGEVRTGKSTVGIQLAWDINKIISRLGKNKDAESYMWKWIFSDQTEFLRFINGDERFVALCIDEFNSLSKTGANSTTEEAVLNQYSDVFAGQYLYRVCMGTDVIIDKNTIVVLDTYGKGEGKDNGVTRCLVKYRDIATKQMATIGYIDVDINELTKNWLGENIRDIVESKEAKSEKDIALIDKWKEKDFYIKYQVKKYRRMNLLKKEGVRDIRELEFASIILDCLEEMEDSSKIGKVSREYIILVVDEIIRRNKRIYSMIAKMDIATKVSAILNLNTYINKLAKKMRKSKYIKPSPEEVMIMKRDMRKNMVYLENRIKEQEHLRDLYREYVKVEEK